MNKEFTNEKNTVCNDLEKNKALRDKALYKSDLKLVQHYNGKIMRILQKINADVQQCYYGA